MLWPEGGWFLGVLQVSLRLHLSLPATILGSPVLEPNLECARRWIKLVRPMLKHSLKQLYITDYGKIHKLTQNSIVYAPAK